MSNRPDESAPEQPQDLTDLSELSFTFEDSASPETPQLPSSPELPAEDELDINQFTLEGDSDSPLPPAAVSEPVDQWYVNSLGQALGPMPLGDVVAMIHSGNLSRGDQVRLEAESEWRQLESVPELAAELPAEPVPPPTPATQPATAAADSGDTAAAKTNDGSAKTPKADESHPKRKNGPKKKRRKKKPKKDEFLNEIFSEVFTEDGKVRSDEAASPGEGGDSANPTAGAAAASAQAATTDTSPNLSAVDTTAVEPATPPPPSATATAPLAAPSIAASMQASPTISRPVVPPPRKAKRRSGGGMSLDPKLLGISAAVLLVIAAGVGVVMGYIPLGFNSGPDAGSIFTEFDQRYTQLASTEISNQEWQKFLTEFGIPTQKLAMEFMPRAASDPQAKQVADTITAMIKLMSCAYDDKEKQAEHYDNFKQLVASTQS